VTILETRLFVRLIGTVLLSFPLVSPPVIVHTVVLPGLLHPMLKSGPHQEESRPLNRGEILCHLTHLVPGGLRGSDAQVDHRVGELSDAVLLGSNPGLELVTKGLTECPVAGVELATTRTELLAGGP
jgi:hypothetical protein